MDLKGGKLACWRHVVVLVVGYFVESAVAAVVVFVAGVFDLDLVEE